MCGPLRQTWIVRLFCIQSLEMSVLGSGRKRSPISWIYCPKNFKSSQVNKAATRPERFQTTVRDDSHRLMARARFSISEFCCLISLMKFMKTLSSWGISLGSVRLRFWYSVAACSFLKDKQLFLAEEDWSAPSAL